MGAILGLTIIVYIIWALFIRGALFKLIIAVFGFIGLREFLLLNFHNSNAIAISIFGFDISYAAAIPLIIIVLAMCTMDYRKTNE